jgi:uncharacterized protein (TIGR02996 family)
MARKKRNASVPLDPRLESALRQYADILDAAPREHRPWLEKVVALTRPEADDVEAPLREMANNMLGRIRIDGLARGVLGLFIANDNDLWWLWRTAGPSQRLLYGLVREMLTDPNAIWRARAVSLVANLAPSKVEAASILTACLQDEAQPVRWYAALSLSHLDPRTARVVEELAHVVLAEPSTSPAFGDVTAARALAGLASPNAFVMRGGFHQDEGPPTGDYAGAPEAGRCLARMGTFARQALPALRERLARGPGRTWADLDAWRAAREAVDAITGSREEGTAILIGWVRRALALEIPGEVGRQLLEDLGRIDPTGVEMGPLFMDALRNPQLAATAAAALYGAGQAGLPALASALGHEHPTVRATASWTLARMGSKAGAAVPALVGALNDPDKDVRQAVQDALASIHSYLFVTRHLGRSEEEAFLESILETLGDEAPCLIYADWLEDHGSAAAQACAQIVRERLLRRRNEE